MNEHNSKPWYREPWLWLVLSPIILVVVVSTTMVAISVRYADDTVSDTYYKDSRMYHYSARQDERARELGLAGMVQFQSGAGKVVLELNGDLEYPQRLLLTLSHPVEADQDRHILLTRETGGRYAGSIDQPLQHRWYLRLMPELHPDRHLKAEWRLKGEIDFDLGDAAPLSPRMQ
ncbi:FixH family protein [Microbulbifer rhizosphaerae]|uniref:Nitrogen fixation protein FixH n=1 Tax=Microbulbifer rhizosphaerae TaxID=1562603 RepID=A0A7W4ZC05_9GAMM|nr:FixH family protein [Microbulbifer rhizosphaerae]MBB3062954.1 hypothetical protein [Microbulbifer rhizosphaerae]